MNSSNTPTSSRTQTRTYTNSPRFSRPHPPSPSVQLQNRNNVKLNGTPACSPPESPSRHQPQYKKCPDLQLALSRVIGTTTTSPATLDSVSSGNTFAFTAGAAVVLVSVGREQHHALTQRFFRARPTTPPLNSIAGSSSLSALSQKDARGSYSPFGSATSGMSSPFSSGNTSEWIDSPGANNKTWSSRERIKAASAVSLSSDGRFLAVGETGYKPRVLIFSTSETNSMTDTPLTALTEHTFGVRAVSFSPNSRYLASLGATNDGFLYIWAINGKNGMATLHACNKCTSTIQQVTWMGDDRFVTVGIRHVKVWRIDEANGTVPASTSSSTPIASSSKARLSDINGLNAPNSPVHGNKNHYRQKTLSGRNCLLGPLLEATFTTIAAITNEKAIICTKSGDICLLDDSENAQKFYKISNLGHEITASAVEMEKGILHIADVKGNIKSFTISELLSSNEKSEPMITSVSSMPTQVSSVNTSMPESKSVGPDLSYSSYYVALSSLNKLVVAIDNYRSIRLLKVEKDSSNPSASSIDTIQQLHAHRDSVLGVRTLVNRNHLLAAFFTWSVDGMVLFWNREGECAKSVKVDLEEYINNGNMSPLGIGADFGDDGVNELRAVDVTAELGYMLSGDKLGVLRIINLNSDICEYKFKAHSAELTEIAIHQNSEIILAASAGRDRTVQIFSRPGSKDKSANAPSWQILQTLEEHVGAVTGLMFSMDGKRLISRSSDRTVVIREYVTSTTEVKSEGNDGDISSDATISGFLVVRTVTLKASPVAMTLQCGQGYGTRTQEEFLWISTIDRYLHRYNIQSGQTTCSFKTADSDAGDSVVLSSLLCVKVPSVPSFNPQAFVLAGVSSTDKSIRLYDERGKLICRDWGHTEGVSAIALANNQAEREERDTTQYSFHDGNREKEKRMRTDALSQNLVTVAIDGTIFIWELEPTNWSSRPRDIRSKSVDQSDGNAMAPTAISSKDIPCAMKTPLRRVLSQSELARLQLAPAIKDASTRYEQDNVEEDEAEESANSISTSNTALSIATTGTSASSSNSSVNTPTRHRVRSPGLRKKSSRLSVAPTPRLEPKSTQTPTGRRANISSEGGLDDTDGANKKKKAGATKRRASIAAERVARRSPSPTSRTQTQPSSPISPRGRRLTQNYQTHPHKQAGKGRRTSIQQWSSGNDKNRTANRIHDKAALSNDYCDSLSVQAEQLCANLRAYRSKIASLKLQAETTGANTSPTKSDHVISTANIVKQVQSELESTLKITTEEMSLFKLSPINNPLEHESNSTSPDNVRRGSDSQDLYMEKLLNRYSERLVEILDERIAAGVAKGNVTGTATEEAQTRLGSDKLVLRDKSNRNDSKGDRSGADIGRTYSDETPYIIKENYTDHASSSEVR